MYLKYYSSQRSDDMPYAISGFFLALSLLIHHTFHQIHPTLTLLLIGLIILGRVISRGVNYRLQSGIWTFRYRFTKISSVRDSDIVRFEIKRRWNGYALRVIYNFKEKEETLDLPPCPFDLTQILSDIEEDTPERLGATAQSYLSKRKRLKQYSPALVVGLISFFAAFFLGGAAFIYSGEVSFIKAEGWLLNPLFYPMSWIGIILIALIFRFMKTRWANPPEMWSTLSLFFFVYLVSIPYTHNITTFYKPGSLVGGMTGIALGFLAISIRSFTAPGKAGSYIAITAAIFSTVFAPKLVYPDSPVLEKTFGSYKGIVYDFGWRNAENPWLWTLAKPFTGKAYSVDGELLAEVRIKVDKNLPETSDYYANRLIQPVTPSKWIVGADRKILIQHEGRDIQDTLWAAGNDTSRRGEIEDYRRTMYMSPGGDFLAWHTNTRKLFIGDLHELHAEEIVIPDSVAQSESKMYLTFIEWVDEDHYIAKSSIKHEIEDSVYYEKPVCKFSAKSGTIQLLADVDAFWNAFTLHEDQIRLWGAEVPRTAEQKEANYKHLITQTSGKNPERILVPHACEMIIEIQARYVRNDIWFLVIDCIEDLESSPATGIKVFATWKEGESELKIFESIPHNSLIIDLAGDGEGITMVSLDNTYLYTWWRIEENEGTWSAKRVGKFKTFFVALHLKSDNAGSMFSPDGSRIFWTYRGFSMFNEVEDAFAIWRIKN
ncbi:MAG: hypothetical protein P9L92_05005 [Candidatus Electryonea clarkiae]|nr:hypothetical protein [Candidatus Electryonea clarkiae]MDP8287202.1 hypothetical protein [Candidatus Electryonea clarkiae]